MRSVSVDRCIRRCRQHVARSRPQRREPRFLLSAIIRGCERRCYRGGGPLRHRFYCGSRITIHFSAPNCSTARKVAIMLSTNPELLAYAQNQVENSCEVKRKLTPAFLAKVCSLAERTCESLLQGGCIFFCGNGGSAADAQHLAADFVGRFKLERKPLPSMALTTNTSLITAIANDYGYEQVFARQIRAFAKPGDILFAISTSGNSPSILI